ncbi:Txe/YoeB family addiction module toxin [Candidatus Tisiphia endosymbiont of Oplodontha viridula]|uniref:Txe/YoeB family addiction module toxin n=1 Tax=Candidatus Tisiphia endosymbiont of Oplodontha viridula TaxID=3077925 RepID=UPI0035C8BCE6
MYVLFHTDAWNDYQYFQENDIKTSEKINKIIRDISRSSFSGIGKPEPLKHSLSGFWSRRINQEHRLVYTIKDNTIYILQCKYHY